MNMISHIRASLLASALMLSTSLAVPAFANEALSLPDLNPTDIARDVQREFNNRTGTMEFIAPTFDPFEQDNSMAGSVSLRSPGVPVTTIDGEVYEDGVIMDIAFYYNSASDDPFDGRGFTDAAFLSGSLAPAVRRDRRILECSRNVRDVVYDHTYYYAPVIGFSIFRPSRFYGGHHRFGRFDRPYWRNRGFRHGNYGGWGRATFPRHGGFNTRDRRDDRVRGDRDRRNDSARNDRDRVRDGNRDRNRDQVRDQRRNDDAGSTIVRQDRRGRMGTTVDRRQPRAENAETRNRDNNRRSEGRRIQTDRNSRGNESRREVRPQTRESRRPVTMPQIDSSPRAANPAPRAEARPAPRRSEVRTQPRSEPRSQPRAQPRAEPRRSESRGGKRSQREFGTIKNSRRNTSSNEKRQLNFFPKRTSYGREVIRSVDVDCAREETLSVFIPAERLQAARFDGLTILALDNGGREYPIFVPPNYIEGFRLATGGEFLSSTSVSKRPSPAYQAPVYQEPRYQEPVYNNPNANSRIEAPCPTGSVKQPNGTCLLTTGQYPR